ncbi:MAG TPA: hypothetical protein PKK60_04115 [archaeon]|nr:hypothetical protein [archaeon]
MVVNEKRRNFLPKENYNALSKTLIGKEREALKRIYLRNLRRTQRRGPPIFFEETIDSRTMRGVVKRLKKQRDSKLKQETEKPKQIASSEKIIRNATASEIAIRTVSKELMSGLKLNKIQHQTLWQLINSRNAHYFPGTKISVGPDPRYLKLKLLNSLGPKKTDEVLATVLIRAQKITQLARTTKSGGEKGDPYVNIEQKIHAKLTNNLSEIMQSTQGAITEGFNALKHERMQLAQLETTNISESEKRIIKEIINSRMNDIRKEIHNATNPENIM